MTKYEAKKEAENCTKHYEACNCIQYKFQFALKEDLKQILNCNYKTIDQVKRDIKSILTDYYGESL